MAGFGRSDLDLIVDIPAMPRGPAPGADASLRARAMMVSWYPETWSAAIAYADAETTSLVPVVGDMTDWAQVVGHPVWVLRDPITGRSELVLGPVRKPGVSAATTAIDSQRRLAGARTQSSAPVAATVAITPVWSGTWSPRGWDTYATHGAGGRAALHQGSDPRVGRLVGLAGYGERIVALAAERITAATLTVRDLTSRGAISPSLQIATSPSGHRPDDAPSYGEPAVDVAPAASGQTRFVDLDEGTCEALRTGEARGLCLVGTDRATVAGTLSPDGMALRITYETGGT